MSILIVRVEAPEEGRTEDVLVDFDHVKNENSLLQHVQQVAWDMLPDASQINATYFDDEGDRCTLTEQTAKDALSFAADHGEIEGSRILRVTVKSHQAQTSEPILIQAEAESMPDSAVPPEIDVSLAAPAEVEPAEADAPTTEDAVEPVSDGTVCLPYPSSENEDERMEPASESEEAQTCETAPAPIIRRVFQRDTVKRQREHEEQENRTEASSQLDSPATDAVATDVVATLTTSLEHYREQAKDAASHIATLEAELVQQRQNAEAAAAAAKTASDEQIALAEAQARDAAERTTALEVERAEAVSLCGDLRAQLGALAEAKASAEAEAENAASRIAEFERTISLQQQCSEDEAKEAANHIAALEADLAKQQKAAEEAQADAAAAKAAMEAAAVAAKAADEEKTASADAQAAEASCRIAVLEEELALRQQHLEAATVAAKTADDVKSAAAALAAEEAAARIEALESELLQQSANAEAAAAAAKAADDEKTAAAASAATEAAARIEELEGILQAERDALKQEKGTNDKLQEELAAEKACREKVIASQAQAEQAANELQKTKIDALTEANKTGQLEIEALRAELAKAMERAAESERTVRALQNSKADVPKLSASVHMIDDCPLTLGIEAEEDEMARGEVTDEFPDVVASCGAKQAFRIGRVRLPATFSDVAPACARLAVKNDGPHRWPQSTVIMNVEGDDFGLQVMALGVLEPGEKKEIEMDLEVCSKIDIPGQPQKRIYRPRTSAHNMPQLAPRFVAGETRPETRSFWAIVDAATGTRLGPLLVFEAVWDLPN